ncbi:hypothetical protein [Bradyrhizobium sp. NFR13]|uniref:hypothetical protein n=1 Tax=Bradyrhizobium sp. NFR13 TaxID=1566285 RepID=UPI000B89A781|nr:hypothetical protein [Bradyrhizobium sp. NFR13]
MAVGKHQQLVQRLAALTASGSLEWRPTSDQSVVLVAFSKYSVLLRQSNSRELPDTYDYHLRIVNGSGDVIEEISDTDLAATMGGHEAYKVMHELFEQARRKALGSDAALDSIIRDLDEIIPF